jgi:hypothetical protein
MIGEQNLTSLRSVLLSPTLCQSREETFETPYKAMIVFLAHSFFSRLANLRRVMQVQKSPSQSFQNHFTALSITLHTRRCFKHIDEFLDMC